MANVNRQNQIIDKKRAIRETNHLTRAPRMENVGRKGAMKSGKKKSSK